VSGKHSLSAHALLHLQQIHLQQNGVILMAIFEDALKGGNIVTGLAIGIGIAVLAPVVRPLVRPVAKSLLKAGVAAYDQGRVALAELNEQAGDMMAEVRAEHEEESANNGARGRARQSGKGSQAA
jgi:hypothetical protein